MYPLNSLCILSAGRLLVESKALAPILSSNSPLRNLFHTSGKRIDLHISNHVLSINKVNRSTDEYRTTTFPSLIQILSRNTSFFNRVTAEMLWAGVTGVSNAGRKRGRGRAGRRMKKRDLNRGQNLGAGNINMVWPGLNKRVVMGRAANPEVLPSDESRMEKIHNMRDRMGQFRSFRMDPLERGWAGTSLGGKSVGPPDPIGTEKFIGFQTKVLESKIVTSMDGNLGRKRRSSMFVVTGNGNGMGGFALCKANMVKDAIRRAKNKAGQKLMYIERCEDRTVYHDFHCQFLKSKIFVKRKPPGYGLVCHRAIKAICEVIGIKDLHAKIEGSVTVQNVTKAFFLGLIQQKTHQDMANLKGLHVVKLEPGDYPRVVASPTNSKIRTQEEIPYTEEMDYTIFAMDGKLEVPRKKYEPFFKRLPSYEQFLKKEVKRRNHDKIKHQLRVAYGGKLESFYTKDHPECIEYTYVMKKKEEEEEEEY